MNVEKEISDLRFDAMRNAIYHTARRYFLDRVNRGLTFIVILAGAGVIGQLGSKLGITDQWLAVIATVAATIQLVFDFGVKARDHEFLQRRFYELIADVAQNPAPNEADVARWRADLQRLYAEEPPPLRALDAIAYNAACDSIGKSHCRVRVTLWQSLMRHLYPFNGTFFPDDKRAVNGTTS
jgi:hypothetical protein